MRSYSVVVLDAGKLTIKNIEAKSTRMMKRICKELGYVLQYISKVSSMVFTTSENHQKYIQSVINRHVYA